MRSAVWISFCLAVCGSSATSQTTPTINACVNNLSGVTRVVASSSNCINGLETFKQWNVTGPQGPQGIAGPTGLTGAQGIAGPAGVKGAQGDAGPAGARGTTGNVGPAGATGSQGPVGPTGDAGRSGPQGLTGPAGHDGPQGASGPTGPQGATGPQGPSGLTFAHTVILPTSGTPAQNGQALFDAVTASSTATVSQPILLQLDAGTYLLPGPLNLPPYVYLKGAGIQVTILSVATGDRVIQTAGGGGISYAGLSQLTSQGKVIFYGAVHITLDYVEITNDTAIFDGQPSDTRITNSILQLLNKNYGGLHVIGSQVHAITFNFSSTGSGCYATYNTNTGVPYSASCN